MPIILYAARLCEQKQPRVFGQTLLRLCQKNLNFGMLVAGDGPDLEWLRAFVKRHGVGNRVRLLGAVSNERVRALMAAADIFFLPSRWEGIALSLYEAMACSLPVVGADVGGQREVVTPECGVLITRSDEETEADQYAQELAGLLRDSRRRREMGQAGRRRVSTSFHIKQREERISFLFQEAQRLHTAQPRPIPGLGLGRACAAQAVEYGRLSDAVNALWQEREQGRTGRAALPPYLLDPYSDRWRTLAYFTIRRLLLPYYHAALNREMKWLLALKDRFKWALLREGR